MISHEAIEKYLNKKTDSWDWIKKYSEKDLNEGIASFDPKPDFGDIKLWLHQKAIFLLIMELKRFGIFLDMGGGKTLLTLAIMKYRKQRGEKIKALILTPYLSATDTWVEECQKHTPELTCTQLIEGSKQNKEILENTNTDFYVMAYPSLVALATSFSKNKKMEPAKVKDFFADFDMLVMDEIHKCKSANTITFRTCRVLSKKCEWVFGLTGTPHGKNLEDLWSQFYLIDLGETLGDSLGFFRSCFFNEKKGYWGNTEYKFNKKLYPNLMKRIKNKSIRYSIQECHDMPPFKDVILHIRPTDSIASYYNKGVEKLTEILKKNKKDYAFVANEYIRLRQLASGFMTFREEEHKVDTRIQIEFDDNPKLEALLGIVQDMPLDSKIVIFHHYVYTNTIISKGLKSIKFKHARVWGGQNNKKNLEELRKFKNDPTCRGLVINTRSGSSSQNLQMANYVVFFEEPDSSIDNEQARRRCWRPGQDKKVFFIHMLMKGTYDEKQMQMNIQGKNLLQFILDGKVALTTMPITAAQRASAKKQLARKRKKELV